MNLLFVCNQGENRSLTAKEMYAKIGYNAKSAGIYSDSFPLNTDLLKWAEIVFVFEENHIQNIRNRFPDLAFEKRIVDLDIEDIYNYGNNELIKIIKKKVNEWLEMLE